MQSNRDLSRSKAHSRAKRSQARAVVIPQQFAMPVRPPTRPGLPSVVTIKPFFVQCNCTTCRAQILVDGAGEFDCPGCGCRVFVK